MSGQAANMSREAASSAAKKVDASVKKTGGSGSPDQAKNGKGGKTKKM